MRVLTFMHSFDLGGVERVALRLIRHWRELGIEAPLFVGRVEGAMRTDMAADLEFVLPPQSPIPIARCETLWMILTLPGVVRRLRPDVLFCAGNSYTVVAVVLKLLLRRDCPPIVAKISNSLDRDDMPWGLRHAYQLWLRIQGRFIDHFVGMESPMAGEIAQALDVPADRITIIPDPALSEALIGRLRATPRAHRSPDDGRRFVAVGRLAAQKNFALMLRAFHRGARPGDSLTIIGDGPDRRKLNRLAAKLGLATRVTFRGYVPEPAMILRDFDVLLLSSDYEGVPAVVLEALAAWLPIIATDCSRSMGELLQYGALGTLVAVGDQDALAAAITDAAPDRGDDALSLAQAQRFTVEHAGEAYISVMLGLLLRAHDGGSALRAGRQHPIALPIGKTCA